MSVCSVFFFFSPANDTTIYLILSVKIWVTFIFIHNINTHWNTANLAIDISINSTLIESPTTSRKFLINTLLTGVSVPCQSNTYTASFSKCKSYIFLKVVRTVSGWKVMFLTVAFKNLHDLLISTSSLLPFSFCGRFSLSDYTFFIYVSYLVDFKHSTVFEHIHFLFWVQSS